MILTNYKVKDRLPEGEYSGIIQSCTLDSSGRYMWFKIDMDSDNTILNINIPLSSREYCEFADFFTDENGEYDTDDFLGTEIDFTLVDRTISDTVYSKFKKLQPREVEDND